MVRLAPSRLAELMTTSRTTSTITLIGGTGHTGRRVADRLRARGLDPRIGSRSGTPPFFWERPETWEPVLRGSTAAYVAYTPDLTHPGAVEAVGALAEQARHSGVERLAFLSGRGEDEAVRAEQAVRAAGLPTAVLRCSVFAQNFSEHFLYDAVLEGVVAMPAGSVAEPFLDIDDLADVAAHVLTAPEPVDEVLELTGPGLLTFAEAAAELSRATGREVTYLPVSVAEFAAGALGAGVPRADVAALELVFGQIFDGRNATTTDTVERVLGRPAGDFADFVRRTAEAGAWGVPA